MAPDDFKRKLTAVFSADAVGYSRLMGEDEGATVKTLESYKKVMFLLIKQHRGRVIDSPGDNLLAEFASVVDAVQCAVAVQNELKARNEELPENRRMQFRIGVNLGDVIEEGDRIYGDGVNIAARLEALADPGGVCVSKTAFDYIETKLPLGYEFLGDQTVKNITKPVGAYKVVMVPRVTGAGKKAKKSSLPVWRRKKVVAAALIVLLAVVGALIWNFYFRPPPIEPASQEKMAYPLPDKPSIAVLPFTNMTGDPTQEYFGDGLSEEIITALSKVPQLFVIARNSSFSYKDKSLKVKQIAEDLGVRYVLEGSVRKEGDRVRITAQLIDALTGRHLWAERYDRKLEDIFSLQDEITMKILTALQVKLTEGEIAQISAKGTKKLEAYLKVLQARGPFYTITKEGFAQARRLCEEAIEIDPDYAAAYVYLGSTHFMDVMIGASKSPKESMKLAFKALTKAKALDDSYAAAHSILGFLFVMKKQYDKGMAECKRALTLEPNSPTSLIWMSLVLTLSGNHDEAVRPAERAVRLDPLCPPWWFRALGQAYSWVGRYEEAISAFKKSLQRAPNDIRTHIPLTCAYSWAGRLEEARAQAREVLRINPKYCLKQDRSVSLYKNKADRERYLDGLRKAGLPETPSLPLPDKPSIAVLPFANISGDPKEEYLSDGITEQIITALSRTPKMLVIARNSVFTYKGKPVMVQQVSEELGVRYVLEGSVQKSGDRLRITAQLIDAKTGNHIWSERYDRKLEDLFAVQDDITMRIIEGLRVKLTEGEQGPIYRRDTENLEAFLKVLKGLDLVLRFRSKEDNALGRQMYEEAIALDPGYATAYALLAWTYLHDVTLRWTKTPKKSIELAFINSQKALSLDEFNSTAYSGLEQVYRLRGMLDKALAAGKKAITLAPNSAETNALHSATFLYLCRSEEALALINKAIHLNPITPIWVLLIQGWAYQISGQYEKAIAAYKNSLLLNPNYLPSLYRLGETYRMLGKYEDAIEAFKKVSHLNPNFMPAHISLAASYSLTGKEDKAHAEAKEVLEIDPAFSIDRFFPKPRYFKCYEKGQKEIFINALRKAGLN